MGSGLITNQLPKTIIIIQGWNRIMISKKHIQRSALKGSLLLSVAMLSISCSNTAPLIKNNDITMSAQVTATTSPTSVTTVKPAAVVVDWKKIEALADTFYKNMPMPYLKQSKQDDPASRVSPVERAYAKSFGLTASEARKRLILQSSSQGVIEAIEKVLGKAFVEAYYINDHPDELRLGITATRTVKASSYIYTFKQEGFDSLRLPIYIYPISDKTKAQIFALQEKATPEIFKRYPDTQSIGYDPIMNTIVVSIYHKTTDEAQRRRIEAELTELVGHRVMVEFMKNQITTL